MTPEAMMKEVQRVVAELQKTRPLVIQTENGSREGCVGHSHGGVWDFVYVELEMSQRSFSAQTHGSTVEDDWSFLGAVLAAVVPDGTPWPQSITTDPNGMHLWRWVAS